MTAAAPRRENTSQCAHKAHTICINSTYSVFTFDVMFKEEEEAFNAHVAATAPKGLVATMSVCSQLTLDLVGK